MRFVSGTSWAVACVFAIAALLSACSKENSYVPPPPPKVEVALPLKETVTPYLYATGNTTAVNSTPLVARVSGFIQEIDYKDGAAVKAGTRLFLIEPEPYELALEQAEAGQASSAASAKQSATEMKRQQDLLAQKVVSASSFDQASAAAAVDVAKQQQSAVDVKQAQLNLSYTEVKAPFDGIVTARQVSIGQLVGGADPTTLATIVQLDPIYVNFNVSEQDVLRVRADLAKRGLAMPDLTKTKVDVEVGLQTETGFPHKGTLDYAAPEVNASTGTLAVRAVFENAARMLLPGYFVRVRVPLLKEPDMLLVPDRAIGSDQSGRYVLVAGKDDVVEQRTVEIGQLVGNLRVIMSGIKEDDRVVISGLLTAVPGQKIEPQTKTLETAAADGAAQ
ncbi:efflux RND transporter periplasmic adaptor subunit [Arvimicrobium flavum]|uniref:efflux RND transporter periplasmic adaptor subunit n=1 Tax=Arvimicrobium flavum TaxID=3393320 RepID=UPI00237BB70E|nr:efflux RND transporter periplasmic adaptor subunit [Mesorhizobium shangrilense]